MNANNAKYFLPLIQALADGKTIQYKAKSTGRWADIEDRIGFAMSPEQYRIKPDPPKELYVVFTPTGKVWATTPEECKARDTARAIGGTYKKFIEVGT